MEKHYYSVLAQFARAEVPSLISKEEGEMFRKIICEEAIKYFNTHSAIATNPKEITEIEIMDEKTIRIVFWSKIKLKTEQVSRSLRLFSMFLLNEQKIYDFSKFISGNRLFKMRVNDMPTFEKATVDAESKLEISDEDTLVELIKIFCNREKNKDIINKIKMIIKENR